MLVLLGAVCRRLVRRKAVSAEEVRGQHTEGVALPAGTINLFLTDKMDAIGMPFNNQYT